MSTKGRVRMQEKQEASLRTNIVFGVLNLCALIVVGILLVMVLRRPFLQIESVTFIGNTMIAEYELRRVTDPLLEEKWLGLVPRTSLLFVPKRRMRTLLPDRISRIEEIRIERNGLRHIVISLREYAPAYLWCTYTETESTTMRTSEICWYVARDGYVFARAPLFSDYVYMKFHTREAEYGEPLGRYVFNEGDFEMLLALRQELESRGVFVYKISQGEHRDIELYIDTLDGRSMPHESHIRIALTQDPDVILAAITAVREQSRFRERLQQGEDLHYIDVRFEGRALFKFY